MNDSANGFHLYDLPLIVTLAVPLIIAALAIALGVYWICRRFFPLADKSQERRP